MLARDVSVGIAWKPRLMPFGLVSRAEFIVRVQIVCIGILIFNDGSLLLAG